ncbi:TPA: tRNA (adenosine(37)-N6)-dimethylallyltransferase MiaA [candidate division CPR2 bacterium]|uniref:tRNA dimethylallyltransferase n=1 Tax=candidate division CPR2 bacterium GW2011_GWC1_41_48 TaxID=1618344 RepID=A0A0G0W8C5_UNCC2|nr:MAG: tRNA dimethylallyltransferase [candidate division CPR2 bacterium GW2011_GWC2_39_35]KKR28444.1 MAG: tRNA dimethylallyltransferase [candidate division CPR2 bacterium GW2011_GWD2_39_7]KKR29048.1 MAG: tRNA dimethylallyltransferase [candidate division CPR2 bacterium GW2011_GWD1_39_7]KKS09230.1 MAG: tRNA dimethylallyltransferase [candidate division CPR2 bacterium GW2011_GWC1_41_48]OGB61816.1 MAG: tRNA (adenosine(37)-N6)-dimethylallyltransferase MiaA [candidate division CPR2 bacterium GWD1_39_
MKNPLIVILGPTATGKTALSIDLAKKYNGEIVNADSQTIYREMDIGTAKPGLGEQQEIPHHLIDIIEPDQEFNVAQYKELADKTIKEIWNKDKAPFLVGGTGLYIDAVVYNYKIPKIKPDFKFRLEIASKTAEELLGRLEELDPEAASTIDPNNKRRLIRAIEIVQKSGEPLSTMKSKDKKPDNVLIIGLDFYSREDLYKRIDKRVNKMMNEGFLEEMKELADNYPWEIPGFNALGYRQLGFYLKGEIDLNTAIEAIKQETRKFAKRQMTWFKRNKDIKWVKNKEEAEKIVKEFLEISNS